MRARAFPLFLAALVAVTIGSAIAGLPPATAAPRAVPAVAQALPDRLLAAAPASHHLSNHNGYNYAVNGFGVGVMDLYEQESAYVLSVYAQDNYWADYTRLDDNPWLQLAATTVARPDFGPLTADRMCHPVTRTCVGPVSLSEHDVFVYAMFGWYGRFPIIRVFILPTNRIGFMMIRNDIP